MDNNKTSKALIVAIALILLCVVGFHLLLPLLGIAIVMSGAAWGIIVATITLFAIAGMLFFIIPGILIALLSLFAFGWVILAIVLFPFVFPLVMPIFIILLFIAYMTHGKRNPPDNKNNNPNP